MEVSLVPTQPSLSSHSFNPRFLYTDEQSAASKPYGSKRDQAALPPFARSCFRRHDGDSKIE